LGPRRCAPFLEAVMDESDRGRNYLALIGDMRRSRSAPRRAELQKLMERTLVGINEEFSSQLAAGFVITLGDEFQGLLWKPQDAVRLLAALDAAFEGDITVRYGLGWGTISTELRELAVGMDGQCFHNAREAVGKGKRDDRWATVSGFGEDDEVLNGTLWLVGAMRGRWTDVQRETVQHVRAARTQREVAAARGVHESSVSQALKAALHEPVLAAEHSVAMLLRRHGDQSERGETTREVGR
jgi:hypothetical protein